MLKKTISLLALCALSSLSYAKTQNITNLDQKVLGTWQCQLDPASDPEMLKLMQIQSTDTYNKDNTFTSQGYMSYVMPFGNEDGTKITYKITAKGTWSTDGDIFTSFAEGGAWIERNFDTETMNKILNNPDFKMAEQIMYATLLMTSAELGRKGESTKVLSIDNKTVRSQSVEHPDVYTLCTKS